MDESQQKYFDLAFRTLNEKADDQKTRDGQHRETQIKIFDKLDTVNEKVNHAQATADDADEHATAANQSISGHLIDHKKRFWVFAKWGLGIFGAVVTALILAWLKLG